MWLPSKLPDLECSLHGRVQRTPVVEAAGLARHVLPRPVGRDLPRVETSATENSVAAAANGFTLELRNPSTRDSSLAEAETAAQMQTESLSTGSIDSIARPRR